MLRALVIACLIPGCFFGAKDASLGGDDGNFPGDAGAGGPGECFVDDDCAPASAKCCDCPTFAVPIGDPVHTSCAGVMCPPPDACPNNVRAACDVGKCELVCVEMACTNSDGTPLYCPDGYAIDPTGCLACTCAQADLNGCTADSQCVETRADCCGCQLGGADTAVLASLQAQFDADLHCPSDPFCPMMNVCALGAAPHCVQGSCALFAGTLPPNACGRSDLPPCPPSQVCAVNVDPIANLEGVGVCINPP